MDDIADPHRGQPVLTRGADIGAARAAMIMIHGRGASAADIIGLAEAIGRQDVTYLAPQASGSTWYPYPFLAPVERNEPDRTSALNVIADLIGMLITKDI